MTDIDGKPGDNLQHNRLFRLKKISILIDLDRLKNLNTGLGQVALNFGRELSRSVDDRIRWTFLVPAGFKGYFGNNVDYEVVSPIRRYLPFLCRKYDLWYALHQDSAYFPSDSGTPYILTIHDLNFLGEKSAPKAARRIRILQKKVDRAVVLTVISKFTEGVVRSYLQTGDKPIHVIYNGVEVKRFPHVPKPDFVPEGDLLFSLGVVQMKKNHQVLIGLMQRLPENFKLVIAGSKSSPYAAQLQQKVAELGLGHRIILPGCITDEEKYWLYDHCTAVLFPSLFEGMGLPPIEAMQFGKPVFASNLSSIPEVCGDNAYYWNNFDPDTMAKLFLEKMEEFRQDSGRPLKLKAYANTFTWPENTRKYLQLFKEVIDSTVQE